MRVKGLLKKAAVVVMIVVLAISAVPAEWMAGGSVRAEDSEEKTYGDFKYVVLEDGTIEITEYIGNRSEVIIPEMIEEKIVTSIKGNLFGYSSDYNIEKIYLPKSITSIIGCYDWPLYRLTDINVDEENTVYYSENGVLFNGVTQTLEKYPLGKTEQNYCVPDGIQKIQWYAFYGCSSLESIELPSSVTIIGQSAFSHCSALATISLQEGVTNIGRMSFCDCNSLINVTIPNSVISIGDYAFAGCDLLESLNIPKDAKLGGGVFSGCSKLENISVAQANESYSSEDGVLFRNLDEGKALSLYPPAKSSRTYVIPDGVTRIDGDAFIGCENLISVQIPESVTDICTDAANGDSVTGCFVHCNNIESFSVAENNETFYSEDGVLYKHVDDDQNEIFRYPSGKAEKAYVIPKDVIRIGDYAFSWCTNLASITISDGVQSILDGAFYNCSGLLDIMIPENVTFISAGYFDGGYWSGGGGTFANCTNLKSVVLPSVAPYIGSEMFYGCSSLTSINIPKNVKMILSSAFDGCTSLQNIDLPENLESIAYYAFEDCNSLNSIRIPNSVTEIGDEALGYIRSEGNTYAKKEGFRIYGGEGTAAQKYAVENGFLFNDQEAENPGDSEPSNPTKPDTSNQQQSNQEVKQPVQNTPVEHTVAVGTILTDKGKKAAYKVISVNSKGGTVTYVKPMSAVSKLVIPSVVTVEGKTYQVTAIDSNAFKNCKKLKTVVIGKGVTSIGAKAFNGCKALKKITIKSTKLKKVGKNAFKGIHAKAVIKVAKAKLKAYQKLLKKKGQGKKVQITK